MWTDQIHGLSITTRGGETGRQEKTTKTLGSLLPSLGLLLSSMDSALALDPGSDLLTVLRPQGAET